MKSRQEGIKDRMIQASIDMTNLLTPGLSASPNAKEIAEINAKATTETYDTGKDPLVIAVALLQIPLPSPGLIGIGNGVSYSFFHNLGYVPSVTLVVETTGDVNVRIKEITETIVTVYNYSLGGNRADIRIYAH